MALSEISKAKRTLKMETERAARLEEIIADPKQSAQLVGMTYWGKEGRTFTPLGNGLTRGEEAAKTLEGCKERIAKAQAVLNG